MTFRSLCKAAGLGAMLMTAMPALADVAVIVSKSNAASLSQQDVSQIYLGKNKALTPLLSDGGAADEFVEKALSRSPSQYKAYWAKLAFTGGGRPPASHSAAEVISKVAGSADLIGVVDAAAVTPDVKVLLTL